MTTYITSSDLLNNHPYTISISGNYMFDFSDMTLENINNYIEITVNNVNIFGYNITQSYEVYGVNTSVGGTTFTLSGLSNYQGFLVTSSNNVNIYGIQLVADDSTTIHNKCSSFAKNQNHANFYNCTNGVTITNVDGDGVGGIGPYENKGNIYWCLNNGIVNELCAGITGMYNSGIINNCVNFQNLLSEAYGIAAQYNSGDISYCINGDLSSANKFYMNNNSSGICGPNGTCNISYCSNYSLIESSSYGICNEISSGYTLSYCNNYGQIGVPGQQTNQNDGSTYAVGILNNNYGTIEYCNNYGNILCYGNTVLLQGGSAGLAYCFVSGNNYGTINNCIVNCDIYAYGANNTSETGSSGGSGGLVYGFCFKNEGTINSCELNYGYVLMYGGEGVENVSPGGNGGNFIIISTNSGTINNITIKYTNNFDVSTGDGDSPGSLGSFCFCSNNSGNISFVQNYVTFELVNNSNDTNSDLYSTFIAATNSGIISNCSGTGIITLACPFAGIAGNNSGQISNCFVNSLLTCSKYYSTSGIVGIENTGTIDNCYFSGAIVTDPSITGSGGIANYSNKGTINNCYTAFNILDYIYPIASSNPGTTSYNSQYWTDDDALKYLTGVPTTIPGEGSIWTSEASETPFILT